MEAKPRPATTAALPSGAKTREDQVAPANRTAGELLKALATRQISSRELVDDAIARIETLDPKINAVVVRDFDRARASADDADAALAHGERRPLLGLPMTVKEQFTIAGLPTTWGYANFRDWRAESDCLPVQRLKAAGAVVLGMTNVPIGHADWQSYNEIYGTTNNPWDLARTPGGSSGGATAALAAGFVSLELGSDIGGSLRAPAHYCGVFSHKPTLDLVPQRGAGPPQTPVAPVRGDLAVAGPMARSAADSDARTGGTGRAGRTSRGGRLSARLAAAAAGSACGISRLGHGCAPALPDSGQCGGSARRIDRTLGEAGRAYRA